MKIIRLALFALTSCVCVAQTVETPTPVMQTAGTPKEPSKYYKLNFVVKDLEAGKAVSAHNFSMIVSTGPNYARSGIRATSKVMVQGDGREFDVGTNIDCSGVTELQDQLTFDLTGDVTSLLPGATSHPIVRQNRWSSKVIVPLKKPTVVFSSDDDTTDHVMQLEVTATPLRN